MRVTYIYNSAGMNVPLLPTSISLKCATLTLQINIKKKFIDFLIILPLKLILCN